MSSNGDTASSKETNYTIDSTISSYILLDDISFKLSRIADMLVKSQHTLSSILEYTKINENRLKIIQRELLDEADEGEFLRTSGVATPDKFVIIDTNTAPGHMVKSYTVKNDGPNTIFVGHNMAISSEVDADIIDTISATSRFEKVLPNEDIKFAFNRNRIRNVHILASGEDSQFRAWLAW